MSWRLVKAEDLQRLVDELNTQKVKADAVRGFAEILDSFKRFHVAIIYEEKKTEKKKENTK